MCLTGSKCEPDMYVSERRETGQIRLQLVEGRTTIPVKTELGSLGGTLSHRKPIENH